MTPRSYRVPFQAAAFGVFPSILQGSKLIRGMPDAAVMASPPTLTASAGAPSGMTVTKNAYSGFGTYWPGFRVSGAPLFASGASTSYPRNARKTDDSVSMWGGCERLEFDFDGQAFAFRLQAVSGGKFKVWANEQPHASAMAALNGVSGVSGAGTHHFQVDFGSRAPRRIVLEWTATSATPTNFSGIVHNPTDTVAPPSIQSPRFMWIGDSYPAGVGATDVGDAFPIALSRFLGFADVWNFTGVASTGTVDTDSGSLYGAYSTRFAADVIPYMRDGDILIYQGSINDTSASTSAVQAAATADLQQLTAALPGVAIIVTSPLFIANPLSTYTDIDTVMAAAAAAVNLPYVSQLDQTLKVFNGTGKVGTTTGDGNADYYRASDGIHPSSAGHIALARHMASLIAPLLGQSR